MDRAKVRVAERLLQAGAIFADEAKADLTSGGGFPKVRTGNLRESVQMSASTPQDVASDDYRVRVGINRKAFYGVILFGKGWKGLKDTMERVRERLMKVIEEG